MSYLLQNYRIFQDLEKYTSHTIAFEIHKMIQVFSNLGYVIDIIDPLEVNAINQISGKKYNLIFGFGETFYQMTNLQPKAISIYYFTENHPDFSLKAETERINYYYERHHKKLKIVRSGKFYKKEHLSKIYNAIIVLGDSEPFCTQYPKVINYFRQV